MHARTLNFLKLVNGAHQFAFKRPLHVQMLHEGGHSHFIILKQFVAFDVVFQITGLCIFQS